eukprot:6759321-Ditylum_brightwellii.AAC.1
MEFLSVMGINVTKLADKENSTTKVMSSLKSWANDDGFGIQTLNSNKNKYNVLSQKKWKRMTNPLPQKEVVVIMAIMMRRGICLKLGQEKVFLEQT